MPPWWQHHSPEGCLREPSFLASSKRLLWSTASTPKWRTFLRTISLCSLSSLLEMLFIRLHKHSQSSRMPFAIVLIWMRWLSSSSLQLIYSLTPSSSLMISTSTVLTFMSMQVTSQLIILVGSAKENDVYDAAIGVGVMLKETLRLKNRSS